MLNNYMVVYDNLPYKVRGFTMYNGSEDFYTIVLNSKYGHESIKQTFLHELKHIMRDDFHSCADVSEIEFVCH